MVNFFQTIPEQSLAARRRLVALGTVASFLVIFLLWFSLLVVGRREAARAPATVSPPPAGSDLPLAGDVREPPPVAAPASGTSPDVSPAVTPAVDVSQISTSLLRVFAPPKSTAQTTPSPPPRP